MLEEMVPKAELVEDEIMEGEEMAKDSKGNILSLSTDVKQIEVVPAFALTLEQAKVRIQMLQEFVQEYMIPGQDYGQIPGCKKPSLFKPGAEKLCDIYGFSKKAEIIGCTQDWEKGIFSFDVKVVLISKRTGHIEAEGLGSCNSKEKKYATQNSFTITNTILKMAKKRALVDAVLSATRSSGIFSQDLEDIDLPGKNEPFKSNKKETPVDSSLLASAEQLGEIYALARETSLSPKASRQVMKNHYGVDNSKLLTATQAQDFIMKLNGLKDK